MKRIAAKSIVLVMMVVSVNGNAQRVNNTVSVQDFNACKTYLSENPTDTVVGVVDGKTVKVFVGTDGRIKRTAGVASSPDLLQNDVHKVKSTKTTPEGVERKELNGTQTSFTKTTINGMGYQAQLDYINGQREAYNIKNRGLDGRLQQRYMVYALGGIHYADDHMGPQLTLGMSKAFFSNIDFGGEVDYSTTRYTDAASVSGSYDALAVYLTGKWYPIQNKYLGGSSRLGIGCSAGYMWQQTDSKSAEDYSGNYGVSMKFYLDAQVRLGYNFFALFQGGGKWYPSVSHHHVGEDGDQEFMDHIGWYAQLGIGYRF
jgi:hypothetical protein